MKKLIIICLLFIIGFSKNIYAETYKCTIDSHGRFNDNTVWEDFGDQNFLITVNKDDVEVYDFKIESSSKFTLILNNNYFINAFFIKTFENEGDWIGMLKYHKPTNQITMMHTNPFGETVYSGFCK